MYQKIIIAGNLGRDPEMRYTPSGQAVTNFSVATNRQYTASDGQLVKETTWFRISAWGRLAETCNQFLTKGKRAYVEGSLRTRNWEGQDGQKRSRTEIVANRVIFLDRAGSGTAPLSDEMPPTDLEADDLPF